MPVIKVLEGDITTIEADVIVNAANNHLILGAGVAGAIRKAGGPSIQEQCNAIGPIELGTAAITGGGNLPAKFVIHAASMAPGGTTTEFHLRQSVGHALRLAEENDCKSIAFPAIGAGIAGFPIKRCAKVMKEQIDAHIASGTELESIALVLFGKETFGVFKKVFEG